MNNPLNLKYNEEHLWFDIDGDEALIGITDYAQEQLGEILFVELPEEGDLFDKDEEFSVVESAKVASSLAAPVKMEILEVNEELDDDPENINEDSYENWIVKVKILDSDAVSSLITAEEYESSVE